MGMSITDSAITGCIFVYRLFIHMKRLIIAGLLIWLTGTSCRKDFTCKCSKIYTDGPGEAVANYETYYYKERRNKAEDHCNANARSGSDTVGHYDISCQIQ